MSKTPKAETAGTRAALKIEAPTITGRLSQSPLAVEAKVLAVKVRDGGRD
jgi:hypothetical protein